MSPIEVEVLLLSIRVACVTVLMCLPLGLLVAWILVRYDFPGKIIFNSIVYLPLVLPPVVVGYLMLITLGRNGFIGEWLLETFGMTIIFSWQGAALAAFVMAFPLMVRSVRLSLESLDTGLEEAARTLGAPDWWVFLTITLPLLMPGLITGSILSFARSLGEFGATITFVGNIPGQTRTIPLALYTAIQSPDGEYAAFRLVVISLTLAFGAVICSEIIARKYSGHLRD